MKIRQLLTLLLIVSTLTACAGGGRVKMNEDVRHSFKTVAIDSDVSIPKNIMVNSATQNISANFGLVGMLVGDSDKRSKTDAVEAAMKKQGIDVSDIVYKKFAREMAKRTPYKPLRKGSKSDATMSIDVHLVGLDVAGAGSRMYPQLTVSAQIKDAKGKTIWRDRSAVGSLQKKNKAKYTYKELIARPARLEEIMTSAAGLVASRVMADL